MEPQTQATSDDFALALWEAFKPGQKDWRVAFDGILKIFSGRELTLKPEQPNLIECARQAIFWQDLAGIRVFPAGECPAAAALLKAPLDQVLHHTVAAQAQEGMYTGQDAYLTYLWNRTAGAIHDPLFPELADSPLDEGMRVDKLRILLATCLLYVRLFLFRNEMRGGGWKNAVRFKPLLELWLDGNIPLGFDAEGRLIVLVKD